MVYKSGISNDRKTCKQVFNILSHQGIHIKTTLSFHLTARRISKIYNTNESHADKDMKQRELFPLLMWVQNCTCTIKIRMIVQQKIESQSASRSICTAIVHITKTCIIQLQTYLFTCISCSFVHHSNKLEPTYVSLHQRMNKENYTMEYYSSL